MNNKYPSLVRRYLAALIDGILLIFSLWVVGYIMQSLGYDPNNISIWFYAIPFILYEPLMTSKLFTLGQFILRFRVKKEDQESKISLWQAYTRIFFKFLLGWVSFMTLPVREDKKAIHDIVAKTIVVEAQSYKSI